MDIEEYYGRHHMTEWSKFETGQSTGADHSRYLDDIVERRFAHCSNFIL